MKILYCEMTLLFSAVQTRARSLAESCVEREIQEIAELLKVLLCDLCKNSIYTSTINSINYVFRSF